MEVLKLISWNINRFPEIFQCLFFSSLDVPCGSSLHSLAVSRKVPPKPSTVTNGRMEGSLEGWYCGGVVILSSQHDLLWLLFWCCYEEHMKARRLFNHYIFFILLGFSLHLLTSARQKGNVGTSTSTGERRKGAQRTSQR